MIKALKYSVLAAGVACAAPVLSAELTAISFGGTTQKAQIETFYNPYQKATGVKVIAGEYNGEMARVKAMVDTKSVSWNLLEVESPELSRGCDEGLFEQLDSAEFGDPDQYIEGTVQPCGVGFFVWSTVLAYNADKLAEAPQGWADFWDVKKYPGKRGLRKGAKYTLEFALMADGVTPAQVYEVLSTPEGVERAFRKLDELKPHIQWWEAGAQPPQYLASGDVVMSSAYNARIAAVQNESNLQIVWNGGIYDFDSWSIPTGAKYQKEALELIKFSVTPEAQKNFFEIVAYGPTRKETINLLSPERLKVIPTTPENIKNQVAIDVNFWVDNGEQLEQRFNAWAAR